MADCPDIATYQLRSAARPGPPRWLSTYVDKGVRLSATFEGDTEAEAYNAACDFWAAEQLAVAKARVARGERAA